MPTAPSRKSFLFKVVVRISFFFIQLFALYLLLRGHSLPGGGFIAGLASTLALVLLSIALGLEEMRRVIRMDPVRLASGGLALALGSALFPTLFGRAFFTHLEVHLERVPILGSPHLSTALVFDIGVFLVVVGSASKLIFSLLYSTRGERPFRPDEERLYASVLERPLERDTGPEDDEPPSLGEETR